MQVIVTSEARSSIQTPEQVEQTPGPRLQLIYVISERMETDGVFFPFKLSAPRCSS